MLQCTHKQLYFVQLNDGTILITVMHCQTMPGTAE